jgi:hypothetical protein
MAQKNTKKPSRKIAEENTAHSKPKFPYTPLPGVLRKFLADAPKKPKPIKVDGKLLKAWGNLNSNATNIIPVLKTIGLVDTAGTPTPHYEKYMMNGVGPGTLADRIREVYANLFQTFHEPYKESQASLKNFFNIHSGGGERTIEYQIQTFKVLCEYADFSAANSANNFMDPTPEFSGNTGKVNGQPTININLHIHMPENKSRADYEEIIKDIGKYIFGK